MNIWWLLACQTPSVDWVSEYRESPEETLLELQRVANPTERLAIVESLQQAFPGQTSDLCQVLPKSTQEYCVERNRRPHLWMPQKETVIEEVSDSKNVDSFVSDCQDVACRIVVALEPARRGQIEKVEQFCSLSTVKEQHECLFATAEKLVGVGGVQQYDSAAEICRLAKSFSGNCQNHLIQQLAKRAPDADTQSTWADVFAAHRAIQTTWGWRDIELQQNLQHRLWSEALGVSYAGADVVVGNPLDVVPEEYHCHIYSAAAWRLFQLEEPSKKNFEEWAQVLSVQLEKRSKKPEAIDQQRKFRAASNLWIESESDSQNVVPYLSTSHRLRSSNPLIEQQLSILEAIARRPPVHTVILEAGLQSTNAMVQQTATRLLAKQPSSD